MFSVPRTGAVLSIDAEREREGLAALARVPSAASLL